MAQQLNKANGTQSATIGTEHTLNTQTDSGVYIVTVNTKNMVNGDALELRAYTKVLTGDSQAWLAYSASYVNAQGDGAAVGSSAGGEVLKIAIPIASPFSLSFTLKQTAGTGRSYDWRVDQLS